uniref:Uncharacterized protein At5g01610 n=1 Tax=Anthurium amnicola TaxID=1678845 RepID=A0A1D1XZ95_9ARAE
MAAALLLLILPLSSFPFFSHAAPRNPNTASAYEELRRSGFPAGLLPTNVLGYSLNRTTGEFAVDLDDRCRITLPPDNYLAAYSRRVTGRLLDHRIAELDGIRVRALFRWWSITGIRSAGDDLVFEVGVASAKYASGNFNESLDCEGRSPA